MARGAAAPAISSRARHLEWGKSPPACRPRRRTRWLSHSPPSRVAHASSFQHTFPFLSLASSDITGNLNKVVGQSQRRLTSNERLTPVLFTNRHILIALCILTAGPVLGLGGKARAGFISTLPSQNSALGASASSASESDAPPTPDSNVKKLLFPLGHDGLGSSCGAPVNHNSSQHNTSCATFALAALQPAEANRFTRLYLKSVLHRPPPFASRLFRPPRLS